MDGVLPQEKPHDHAIKLVVVGDSAAGKTSLLTRFATGSFPEDCEPPLKPEPTPFSHPPAKLFPLGNHCSA